MRDLWTLETGVPGVRLAQPADEGEIFALLLMLHSENGMFGLNRDKVIAGIQWATQRRGGVIFCIDDDHRIVATMGMCISCDWYSDDEYLLERWNYVHPDYRRGTDYARKLLEQGKWASEWFKAQGRPMAFQCGINSFERVEAKVRLYARHMPCIGAYFMYGLPPRQAEKAQQEMRAIEELNKGVRGQPRSVQRGVRPVVETILRVSKEGEDHVQ